MESTSHHKVDNGTVSTINIRTKSTRKSTRALLAVAGISAALGASIVAGPVDTSHASGVSAYTNYGYCQQKPIIQTGIHVKPGHIARFRTVYSRTNRFGKPTGFRYRPWVTVDNRTGARLKARWQNTHFYPLARGTGLLFRFQVQQRGQTRTYHGRWGPSNGPRVYGGRAGWRCAYA